MSDIAKPNFHAGKVIIVAQGVRISELETALASSQEEIARLRKALEPFGRENDLPPNLPDSTRLNISFAGQFVAYATFGDFRSAARALASQPVQEHGGRE